MKAHYIKNIYIYGYDQTNVSLKNIYLSSQGEVTILALGANKLFSAAEISATEIIDAEEKYALMPGWLDAHIHGYGGHDFADKDLNVEKLAELTEKLGETGLSYCMATLLSLPLTQLEKNLKVLDAYIQKQNKHGTKPGATTIVGVHLEGPFIAKNCKGAHDENVLQSKINIDIFKQIICVAPHISHWKITLAPEIEGAIDFIRQTKNLQIDGKKIHVQVFLGHSNASENFIEQAIAAGAIGFTHLGNANCESMHRSKHPIQFEKLTSHMVRFALSDRNKNKNFFIELIADGEHLSSEFMQFVLEKKPKNILLITDALGPSGLENDREYTLGSLKIIKKNQVFVLKNQPEKLAGSAATYTEIINKFNKIDKCMGLDLWEKLYLATVLNPRKTSLPPDFTLPDQQNFVVIDTQGKLIMSGCNGVIIKNK